MKLHSTLFLGISLFFCSLTLANAHGLGLSLEEKVGSYLIDIGYDQELIAGEKILFDFNLYNQRRDGVQEAAEYTDVAFEVMLNSSVVFTRTVPRNAAKTFMTVLFPTAGQYNLHASFFRGEEKFAETTFTTLLASPVTNNALRSPLDIFEIAMYAVGLIVCAVAGLGLFLSRARRDNAPPTA